MAPGSVLIIAPHPDDETLGCGGTLAQRIQQGCSVAIVVVTDGRHLFRLSQWKIESDPTPAEASLMRKDETLRAVTILGSRPEAVRFLDVEDGTLEDHLQPAIETIAHLIDELTPQEIYVTSEHERHPDHVAACAVVRAAMQKTQSRAALYRYTIELRHGLSLSTIDQPSLALDISAQLELKRQAVSQFNSHLKIVARGQTQPFFLSTDDWLQPQERFFVDRA